MGYDTRQYKNTHKAAPDTGGGKPHQSVYIPKHPEKVIGGEIIARSSWESAFARWCDDNPAVIEWGCEVVSIQYRDPSGVNLDECKKVGANPADPYNWPVHNYYPDFYVVLRDEDDTDGTKTEVLYIEIKPKYQTERPVPPPAGAKLQEQKKFVNAAKMYLQNIEKWKAAIAWCNDRGAKFRVFTEDSLAELGLML